MSLAARCRERLKGVHPDLVRLVERVAAESPHEFVITEGVRSKERQRRLLAAGASRTLNSRHLTGDAIDFAVKVNGAITWEFPLYAAVAAVFERIAAEMEIPITWGGRWKFRDGTHIELKRAP